MTTGQDFTGKDVRVLYIHNNAVKTAEAKVDKQCGVVTIDAHWKEDHQGRLYPGGLVSGRKAGPEGHPAHHGQGLHRLRQVDAGQDP